MELYVIASVFYFAGVAIFGYATKRYFDDRAAARDVVSGISESLETRLSECIVAINDNSGLVKERLTVFEKALANAISQFAEIVKETRSSELETKAKTIGQALKLGHRKPAP